MSGETHTFREYYFDKLYADINSLQKYGFDAGRIKSIMDNAYPMLETSEAFLIHGDFDSSHIFHVRGRYSGIIDFGEIRGSHYLYDLGHFKLHENADRFKYLAKGIVMFAASPQWITKKLTIGHCLLAWGAQSMNTTESWFKGNLQ